MDQNLHELTYLLEELKNVGGVIPQNSELKSYVTAVEKCQGAVINHIAGILANHFDCGLLTEAAIEAYDVVISRRYSSVMLKPENIQNDNLKLHCVSLFGNVLCSSIDERNESQFLYSVLRVLLPVADAITFFPDSYLRSHLIERLTLLFDVSPVSLKVLVIKIFIEIDWNEDIAGELQVVSSRVFRTLCCLFNEECNFEFAALLLQFLNKKLPNIEIQLLYADSDFMVSLSRLLRLSASKSQNSAAPQRQVVIGILQLLGSICSSTTNLDILNLEILSELVERLRSTVDDLVSEAALCCIKAVCLNQLFSKKFYELNCHVVAFKWLVTESLPTFLKMRWIHLLMPCFELLDLLTKHSTIPDSLGASKIVLQTVTQSLELLGVDDIHLPIYCAARLFECRCATLPLVYDETASLIGALNDNLMKMNEFTTEFLASISHLAVTIVKFFDWPGFKTAMENPSPDDMQVRFAAMLVRYTASTFSILCRYLDMSKLLADASKYMQPAMEALAVCIEQCDFKQILKPIFEIFQDSSTLLHCLTLNPVMNSHRLNSLIQRSVSGLTQHKLELWNQHSMSLAVDCSLLDLYEDIKFDFLNSNIPISSFIEFSLANPKFLQSSLILVLCLGAEWFLSQSSCGVLESFLWQAIVAFSGSNEFQLYLAVGLSIELAYLEPRLISTRLAGEIDCQIRLSPLWFLIQPEISAWALIRLATGDDIAIHDLLESILNFDFPSIEKWSCSILLDKAVNLTDQFPHFLSRLASFFVTISLNHAAADHKWLNFCSGIFLASSAVKIAVFGAVVDSLTSVRHSKPTAAFLHLATLSLCGNICEVEEYLSRHDKLSLASYLCRLPNLCRGENAQDLWLQFLNFLNSILIVCWKNRNEFKNLENFVLTMSCHDGLFNGLLKLLKNRITPYLYAAIITTIFLWRFSNFYEPSKRLDLSYRLSLLCRELIYDTCNCSDVPDFRCFSSSLAVLALKSPITECCREFCRMIYLNGGCSNKALMSALIVTKDQIRDGNELNPWIPENPWIELDRISNRFDKGNDDLPDNQDLKCSPVVVDYIVVPSPYC